MCFSFRCQKLLLTISACRLFEHWEFCYQNCLSLGHTFRCFCLFKFSFLPWVLSKLRHKSIKEKSLKVLKSSALSCFFSKFQETLRYQNPVFSIILNKDAVSTLYSIAMWQHSSYTWTEAIFSMFTNQELFQPGLNLSGSPAGAVESSDYFLFHQASSVTPDSVQEESKTLVL